jgi:hypothetical protein
MLQNSRDNIGKGVKQTMNEWVKTVLDWTQTKGKQIPNGIKGIVDKFKTKPSLSVNDLATVIMLHPDTEIKQNEWLGLTFHFYRLQIGKFTFCLETKGKEKDYILLCKVLDENGIISEYTSYDEEMSLRDRMKVPRIKLI